MLGELRQHTVLPTTLAAQTVQDVVLVVLQRSLYPTGETGDDRAEQLVSANQLERASKLERGLVV
jgi:hypothetical protein